MLLEILVPASGDMRLFSRLQPGLESGLPVEAIEWKRSFGRASKTVNISASFVPFDAKSVAKATAAAASGSGVGSLRGCPLLHTFWIECADLDHYKANVRDEIVSWLGTLRRCAATPVPGHASPSAAAASAVDWAVILVEAADTKKTNKLLARTSVIDKLKSEVGGKQPERCISLIGKTHKQGGKQPCYCLLKQVRIWKLFYDAVDVSIDGTTT